MSRRGSNKRMSPQKGDRNELNSHLDKGGPIQGLHRLHSVTARRIAQPPKVTFVTRLQLSQLPGQTARQLPDLSTIFLVESSSTGVSRLRGALPRADSCIPQRCISELEVNVARRWIVSSYLVRPLSSLNAVSGS